MKLTPLRLAFIITVIGLVGPLVVGIVATIHSNIQQSTRLTDAYSISNMQVKPLATVRHAEYIPPRDYYDDGYKQGQSQGFDDADHYYKYGYDESCALLGENRDRYRQGYRAGYDEAYKRRRSMIAMAKAYENIYSDDDEYDDEYDDEHDEYDDGYDDDDDDY